MRTMVEYVELAEGAIARRNELQETAAMARVELASEACLWASLAQVAATHAQTRAIRDAALHASVRT